VAGYQIDKLIKLVAYSTFMVIHSGVGRKSRTSHFHITTPGKSFTHDTKQYNLVKRKEKERKLLSYQP